MHYNIFKHLCESVYKKLRIIIFIKVVLLQECSIKPYSFQLGPLNSLTTEFICRIDDIYQHPKHLKVSSEMSLILYLKFKYCFILLISIYCLAVISLLSKGALLNRNL